MLTPDGALRSGCRSGTVVARTSCLTTCGFGDGPRTGVMVRASLRAELGRDEWSDLLELALAELELYLWADGGLLPYCAATESVWDSDVVWPGSGEEAS